MSFQSIKWAWTCSSQGAEGGSFCYWAAWRIRAGSHPAWERGRGGWWGVGAADKGRAEINAWCAGQDHRPGGTWTCLVLQQQGSKFTAVCNQHRDWKKSERQRRNASLQLLHIASQLRPLNGIGNKHKQLASAALLAEHVTTNCFIQATDAGWLQAVRSDYSATLQKHPQRRQHIANMYIIFSYTWLKSF